MLDTKKCSVEEGSLPLVTSVGVLTILFKFFS